MAMDGIFWTKTWGAMFLVSFLVVEVLVILSWKYSSHTPLPETQDTHRPLRIRANMERSDEQPMAISANLYFFILVWAIIDIYNGFEFSSMLERDPIIPSAPVTFIQTLWGILVLRGFLIFVPSIIYFVLLVVWPKPPFVEEYMANNTFTYGKYGPAARIAIRISGLACLGIMGLSITQWKAALLKSLYSWVFVIALAFPGFIVLEFLRTRADSWPRLSRSVFITWESEEERSGNEKTWGYDETSPTSLCFVMFLYTTILAVIWYWFRYNPEGTLNRGWTGVFG